MTQAILTDDQLIAADEQTDLVSVGMPVFNDKQFLVAALDSILGQSYRHLELIISDDCSTDGSSNICREYAARDPRVKYFRQEKNLGISKNMEFLLKQGRGKYFMWAGNDDLWHVDFVKALRGILIQRPDAIVAFCNVEDIGEDGKLLDVHQAPAIDYGGETPVIRLKKLIARMYDGFGYGLFLREQILGVRFPIWWWVNRSRAYNNIFPSLCYYLAKGDYAHYDGEPLWFNRMKNVENVKHKMPYDNSFIRGSFAFTLWKFNLVVESLASVYRADRNVKLLSEMFFPFFGQWFWKPVVPVLKNYCLKLYKGQVKFW